MERALKRFDQFDYEELAAQEKWGLGQAMNMLTSIEMEVKKYFLREDRDIVFNKIYKKYWNRITNLMLNGDLEYSTVCDLESQGEYISEGYDPFLSIREYHTYFTKNAFFVCIQNGNIPNIDIITINKYLSGELIPNEIDLPESSSHGDGFEWTCGVKNKTDKVKDAQEHVKPAVNGQAHVNCNSMQIVDRPNAIRVIKTTIDAIQYCLNNEHDSEVSNEDLIHYLTETSLSNLDDAIINEICACIQRDIRTAAVPLDVKDKRRYGILKNEKANQQYVIRATVEATRHMSELPPGTEINAAGMFDWLYSRGYKDLTKRMHEQIWQALPSTHKKPAGAPTKKKPKK